MREVAAKPLAADRRSRVLLTTFMRGRLIEVLPTAWGGGGEAAGGASAHGACCPPSPATPSPGFAGDFPASGEELHILGRLRTAKAVEIAGDWVARYAAEHPEFLAAHLMGGITSMSPDDEFPYDADLDLMLVVDSPITTEDPLDELYRGVAIEAGLRGKDEYESAEKVLANPAIADHIAAGAILSDPTGLLSAVQPAVAREFSRQRWVRERCAEEKRRFEMGIAGVAGSREPMEALILTTLAIHNLASVLAVAQLVPPTHRKSLLQLRRQLDALDRLDLFEEVLEVSGVATLTVAQVQSHADRTAQAFDRAIQVHRTRVPLDFKLQPHLRPYLVDGFQSLIDTGHHREAMPWIAIGASMCCSVLLVDAPDTERPRYAALAGDLVNDMGFANGANRSQRLRHTDQVKESMYALADEIVANRPDDPLTP